MLGPLTLARCARQLSMPTTVVSSSKFLAPDDSLLLEDEAARVKLRGDVLDVPSLCSGALVGLLACLLTRAPRLLTTGVRNRRRGCAVRIQRRPRV